MEFKNLAEVELLGEVPEGASVLAATADGEVVRVPGDGLGGGGGAGCGQFIINIELSGDGNYLESDSIWETDYGTDGGGAVCDKSFDEIKSAYESGLIPVVILRQRIEEDSDEVYFYTSELVEVYLDSEDPINSNFIFGGVYGYINNLSFSEVCIYPDSCNVYLAGRSL